MSTTETAPTRALNPGPNANWNLVVVESPFRGEGPTDQERRKEQQKNEEYARECMAHCFSQGEAPFASHLLYTQPGVLDDERADERDRGMAAGLAWGDRATKTVVYTDRGISDGMRLGIEAAKAANRTVEHRVLPGYAKRREDRILQLENDAQPDWSKTDEYFKYWSRCEDVTMHFNELAIKFRLQAISGLTVTGSLMGLLIKISDPVSWIPLAMGLLLLSAFWIATMWIDCYYSKLLRGAIEELLRVEGLSNNRINLSTAIEKATNGARGARVGRFGFYVLPLLALLVAAFFAIYNYNLAAPDSARVSER